LNSGRHASHEAHDLRRPIDVDVHWHALREAHPSKDGIHGGEPSEVRLRVWDVDARAAVVD
jgi:hypothetical protein